MSKEIEQLEKEVQSLSEQLDHYRHGANLPEIARYYSNMETLWAEKLATLNSLRMKHP